jgi:hypothetical protein
MTTPEADRLSQSRPKVITDLLAVDDTGVVANYIRTLEATSARLRTALEHVSSTARSEQCWCDNSHDVARWGHQPKCEAAKAALGEPDGRRVHTAETENGAR